MAARKTSLYNSHRSDIWKVECPSKPIFVSKEFSASSSDTSLEIGFHERLKNIPGVVRFIGADYGEQPVLYMQYCEKGSLKSFIEGSEERISEELLLFWYRSMARSMRLMHAGRVVHRVINASNWLVTADLHIKLTDFGHARVLERVPGIDTRSESLRDEDTGQSTGVRTKQIFAEDALRLAKVFYQMATFDFNIRVLSLQNKDIYDHCERRGYSSQVSSAICHLLSLRKGVGIITRQAEVGEILMGLEQPFPDNIPASLELEDLEEIKYPCSLCNTSKGIRQFQCEHWICETCERRLLRHELNRGDIEICELCGNTVTSAKSPRVMEAGFFDFSQMDFSA